MHTRNHSVGVPPYRVVGPRKLGAAPWIGIVVTAALVACGGSSVGDDDAAPLDAPLLDAPPSDAPPSDAPSDAPPDAPPNPDAGPPDAPSLSCEPTGTGAVTGSVLGNEIAPVVSAWTFTPGNGIHLLVIDEFDNTCNIGNPVPSDSEHLVIATCEPPAAGLTFTVTSEFPQGPCPGQALAFVFLEDGGGSDIADASSGTIAFDESGPCVSGSLDLDFAGETMTGTFSAIVCP